MLTSFFPRSAGRFEFSAAIAPFPPYAPWHRLLSSDSRALFVGTAEKGTLFSPPAQVFPSFRRKRVVRKLDPVFFLLVTEVLARFFLAVPPYIPFFLSSVSTPLPSQERRSGGRCFPPVVGGSKKFPFLVCAQVDGTSRCPSFSFRVTGASYKRCGGFSSLVSPRWLPHFFPLFYEPRFQAFGIRKGSSSRSDTSEE